MHDCAIELGDAWLLTWVPGILQALEPDGILILTFDEGSTGAGCCEQTAGEGLPAICQQLFVRSVDSGATWSQSVKVADDFATQPLNGISGNIGNGCPLFRQCLPPNGYRISNFPSMGVDTGNGSDGCLDFRLSSSSNDGVTWSTQRITTSSSLNLTDVTNPVQQGFIGDYNSIHVAGNNVYMTWADTQGLNGVIEQDAYFAKVPKL